MSRVLRGAIVGFGSVAERGHLPAWRAREDMQIVAVVDAREDRRARAHALLSGARLYAQLEDLLRMEQLDFVDIAIPPALHAAAIVSAAKAGCNVLCEKPLVLSRAEREAVQGAVQAAGVILFTVHNWQHSDAFRRVRALLASGVIGSLQALRIEVERNGCSSAQDGWRMKRALAGGGILVDHGWHAFYLIPALVGGRPTSVEARIENRRYARADVEDTAHCRIRFPSLVAELELTWAGRQRNTRWQLVGRDGAIEVANDRLRLERRGEPTQDLHCVESLSGSSHHPEWFGAVIEGFCQEVAQPARRGTNLREAALCLDLLLAAYASSAADGRAEPVAATPSRERAIDAADTPLS